MMQTNLYSSNKIISGLLIFIGLAVVVTAAPVGDKVKDSSTLPYVRADFYNSGAVLEINSPHLNTPTEFIVNVCKDYNCSSSTEHREGTMTKIELTSRCPSELCTVDVDNFFSKSRQTRSITIGFPERCHEACAEASRPNGAVELQVEEGELYGQFADLRIEVPVCPNGIPSLMWINVYAEEGPHEGRVAFINMDVHKVPTGTWINVRELFRESKMVIKGRMLCCSLETEPDNIIDDVFLYKTITLIN